MKKKKNKTADEKKKVLSTFEPAGLSTGYHVPVLLQESVDGLNIKAEGVYVDCTFGGGGHSKAILEKLSENGRLYAFDQDEDAAANVPDDDRLIFVPQNFRYIQRFLRLQQVEKVDGIFADLGVSSHQFDEADRGFSIRFDGDLDMRMDRRQPLTAFEIVQSYSEAKLHKLFEQYGEVTNAKTLAKKIVDVRAAVSLKTIDAFKHALHDVVKGNPNKYFAQVFQALRMEVNEEMIVLKEMLQQSLPLLKNGGHIAVITFHSIEDRMVKNFFRDGSFEAKEDHPYSTESKKRVFHIITKKPIIASENELRMNARSRSAKLRIAEKQD